MNDFEKYLLTAAVEIKKEIKNVLSEWSLLVENQTPSLKKINDLFIKSFDGGKYIRGTLVKLGYQIASTSNSLNSPEILKVAAAFEILHTSLLIHDDIIDKSLIRRGKPTIHSVFKNNHYGISQAICLGDIGFFLATKLLLDKRVLSSFSNIVLETILGQMLDIKTSFEKSKKEKDVIVIQKLKTAYYTISAPLSIGAMMGNATQKKLNSIKTFGENLGIAYQIKDDILGVFGDEKIIGKSASSDIEENKSTLLIAYALEKAKSKKKKFLSNYYGTKNINKKQIEEVKKIFVETGSLNYSQIKAEQYINKAKKIVPEITKNKIHQNYLHQFSDFILERKK